MKTKIYALTFAILLTLWSSCASAQSMVLVGPDGGRMVRVGERVVSIDKHGAVIARGTARGGIVDLRTSDGDILRFNSRNGGIYHYKDGQRRVLGVGIMSRDARRFAK